MQWRWSIVLSLVACGSSDPTADCTSVAATMLQKAQPRAALGLEQLGNLRAVISNRCVEDRWSDEVRACMSKAADAAGIERCASKLTSEQKSKLDRAAEAVLSVRDPVADGSPPPLAVTSIEPAKGDSEGGTYTVIRGTRFLKDGPRNVKVYFGSRQGSVIRFQSDTELIVEAPGGKVDEVVDVLLIFDPGGQLRIPDGFTFVDKAR